MTRECTRAVLHLTCDERLVCGVGAAMAHFAERAGLGEGSCRSLVTALEEFCLDALPFVQGTGEPLDVAIEDFEDRIQIVVEHRNAQSTAGRTPLARSAQSEIAPEGLALRRLTKIMDRVECDTRNGSIRTTLVKFL